MELKMIDQFAIVNTERMEEEIHRWKEKWKTKGLKRVIRK